MPANPGYVGYIGYTAGQTLCGAVTRTVTSVTPPLGGRAGREHPSGAFCSLAPLLPSRSAGAHGCSLHLLPSPRCSLHRRPGPLGPTAGTADGNETLPARSRRNETQVAARPLLVAAQLPLSATGHAPSGQRMAARVAGSGHARGDHAPGLRGGWRPERAATGPAAKQARGKPGNQVFEPGRVPPSLTTWRSCARPWRGLAARLALAPEGARSSTPASAPAPALASKLAPSTRSPETAGHGRNPGFGRGPPTPLAPRNCTTAGTPGRGVS
jgi:hypothetical protein